MARPSTDKASLAPIIVALLVIAAVSAMGLLIAWWPQDTAAAKAGAQHEAQPVDRAEPARESFSRLPARRPEAKWI